MSIREAFFKVCREAQPVSQLELFVSLYIRTPYYGGPEEGGWWGTDVSLLAYQEYSSEKEAQLAFIAIDELAEQLNSEEKRAYGEKCLAESEWLEARGLDDSFLPEVDGEEEYLAVIEEKVGSLVRSGCRRYE